MRLAGFVLAGGESTRMGRDKALLDWNGEPLLTHVCREVAGVVRRVVVLGAAERYAGAGFVCWDDVHPGLGPLGALETMLSRTEEDWNLVVAVDLPAVDAPLLRQLKETAGRANALATVVREGEQTGGARVHPLCGIYRRGALAAVRDAIARRELRVQSLVNRLKPAYHDIPYRLINVNAPEDWSAFLAAAGRGR